MSSDIKLGYCILKNPFSEERETMIFITLPNSPTLNAEIMDQPAFNRACRFLKRMGFVQTEPLTFENAKSVKVNNKLIRRTLDDVGMSYNKNLEASLRKELTSIAEEAEKEMIRDAIVKEDLLLDVSHYIRVKNENTLPLGSKYRIPAIGETIELYFYLFLEGSLLRDGEIIYNLNGDFYTKKGNTGKRFVKPIGAKFRRIDRGNSKELYFESVPNYNDFIEDIDCLYTATFRFQTGEMLGYQKDKIKKVVSILEVASEINLANYITISLKSPRHFSQLVTLSSEIKNEMVESKDRTIPVDFLLEKSRTLIKDLNNKMLESADAEEYERAAFFKKTIKSLNKRINWMQKSDKKELTLMEYDIHLAIGGPIE